MKSRGLMVYSAVSRMMTDSAILKLKNISKTMAGSGSTIIARIMMMMIGAASALALAPRIQMGRVIPFIPALHAEVIRAGAVRSQSGSVSRYMTTQLLECRPCRDGSRLAHPPLLAKIKRLHHGNNGVYSPLLR